MPSPVLLTCANSARLPLSMLDTTNPVVAQYTTALTVIAISPSGVGFEPPPRRARQYDACHRGEIDSRDTGGLARKVGGLMLVEVGHVGVEPVEHPCEAGYV